MLINRMVLGMVAAVFFISVSLMGQDETEENEAAAVLPAFPGEKVEKSENPADPKELLDKAMEKLGGAEAFGKLKDLTFKFKHQHYSLIKETLHHKEIATGYIRFEDPLKARLDFENYSNPSDLKTFFDYREILGSEGPFKYLEGRLLRTPLAAKEAGERLYRNFMIQFMPFCLIDLNGATLDYLGTATWNDEDEPNPVSCHKILINGLNERARISGNVMAVYVDDEHVVRRIVYLPRQPADTRSKTQVVDFMERVNVAGLDFPAHLVMITITKGTREALHRIWYSDYKENTGLEGVGFELLDQEN